MRNLHRYQAILLVVTLVVTMVVMPAWTGDTQAQEGTETSSAAVIYEANESGEREEVAAVQQGYFDPETGAWIPAETVEATDLKEADIPEVEDAVPVSQKDDATTEEPAASESELVTETTPAEESSPTTPAVTESEPQAPAETTTTEPLVQPIISPILPSTTTQGEVIYQQQSVSTPLVVDDSEIASGRTLRDFISNAFVPAGETLYVWGGGWTYDASGAESKTVGASLQWKNYFLQNAGQYDYKLHRYESHNGLDCSGFVSWALYNTMETESGNPSYLVKSTYMAASLAKKGWGTYIAQEDVSEYKVGDIVSMDGHVWISLGQCDDGSVVVLHSTPNAGVQISGTVNAKGEKNSEAYRIALESMKKYFPYWSQYYIAKSCGSGYFKANVMRWNVSSEDALTDPEGIQDMDPQQVIDLVLGERPLHEYYIDVDSSEWYVDAVETVLQSNLMNGMGFGEFQPNGSMTRAMTTQVIANLDGVNLSEYEEYAKEFFRDVDKDEWYFAAASWAADLGVTSGVGENEFAPNQDITRQEFVAMIVNYMEREGIELESMSWRTVNYTDKNSVRVWAQDAICKAVKAGLISGYDDGSLRPENTITRAEGAKIFTNALAYIRALEEAENAVKQQTPTTEQVER